MALSKLFRKPSRKEYLYIVLVAAAYLSALLFVYINGLSFSALFRYGLLQPPGITGEEARFAAIETPLSWNIPLVLAFIYLKGSAVLVELFQYWVIGMFLAGILVAFVPWEEVKRKMGFGGLKASLLAATAGAVIPICSCGIVPVLAGMVKAGIPLGPTMAFLIAAPMLNIPAVFITATVLGVPLAIGRILGTFFIALTVGMVISSMQQRQRFLRRFIKTGITPALPPELQQLAFRVAMKLSGNPSRKTTEELAPGEEEELMRLGEAGVLDRDEEGRWFLPPAAAAAHVGGTAACFVLPEGSGQETFREKAIKALQTGWDFFLQLNYYLLLAVLIAGAIKVLIPTEVVVNLVGGQRLDSVLLASLVAVLAYVCTYVEVPTALALVHKGMGAGATLAYLLGGPGLSLPAIVMLSAVFRKKIIVLYVAVSFIGCVLAGVLFNLFRGGII